MNNLSRIFIYLSAGLVFLFCADLFLGSVLLNPKQIIDGLVGSGDEMTTVIVRDIRLPKAITSLLVGMSLAFCGLILQTLFRNPLAGPYVLGISSGASLGVAIMMMGGSFIGIELVSFSGKVGLTIASCTGAFVTLLFVLGIAGNLRNNIGLLLVGIMIGFMTGAFQSILEYISSAESLKSFSLWGMGSVGNTTWSDLLIMFPITLITILYGVRLIKPLNAIQLGDGYATSLGIDVRKIRISIIIITGILTGITTAFCGPIAFIGIALPHAGRLILKSADHRYLIPASLLLGGSALLLCDIISQLPGTGYILPVNIVTSIIGAPLIIYLILKNRG